MPNKTEGLTRIFAQLAEIREQLVNVGGKASQKPGYSGDEDKNMPNCFTIQAEAGEPEKRTYQGREHTVIPLVALVEGVVQGALSKGPEFVSAEAMQKTVSGWNGRPVVVDHPKVNGVHVSANSPAVLETEQIGYVFNAVVENNKLKMEAYIDPDLDKPDDTRVTGVVNKIKQGDVVELSTSFFAEVSEHLGIFKKDGTEEAFEYTLNNLVPDHMAILSEGAGACSIADGCGTNRVYASVSKCSCEGSCDSCEKPTKLSAQTTHNDIRFALVNKLSDVMPDDWFYIYAVADESVIYETSEGLISRAWSLDAAGSITLGEETTRVRPDTSFVPNKLKELSTMPTKAEMVAGLIANDKAPFTESNKASLEAFEEATIKSLFESYTATEEPVAEDKPAAPAAAPEGASEEPTPEPEQKANVDFNTLLASAPKEIQESLAMGQQMLKNHRDHLVTAIKANTKNQFTDPELATMDMPMLERVFSLAQAEAPAPAVYQPSYAGAPVPRVQAAQPDNGFVEPPAVFEVGKGFADIKQSSETTH